MPPAAPPPKPRNIEPDLGKVGVAVGEGVHPGVGQTEHGNQHPDVPKPADEEIGMRSAVRSPPPP